MHWPGIPEAARHLIGSLPGVVLMCWPEVRPQPQ